MVNSCRDTGRAVKVPFLTAAALLLMSIIVTYWAGVIVLDSNRTLSRQRSVINELDRLYSAVKDADLNLHAYLLTGEEDSFKIYKRWATQVGEAVAGIRRLAAEGEISRPKAQEVIDLVEQKLASLEEMILLNRTDGFATPPARTCRERGRQLMNVLLATFTSLRAAEIDELRGAADRLYFVTITRSVVLLTIAILNVAFLAWAYQRISSEMVRRTHAMEELDRRNELLVTTLASIGDAVIVTDNNGRVAFMNHVAELLTAWSREAAIGCALDEVLTILNGETNQLHRNGYLLAERDTSDAIPLLLLRRTGQTLPIDAIGAPICGKNGVYGAVMILRDVTAQREAERRIKESEDRFRIALQNTPVTVYTHDLELRYAWIHNPPLGLTAEAMLGKRDEDLFSSAGVQELIALKQRVLESGHGERQQITTAVDGRLHTFDVTVEQQRDMAGHPSGLIVASLDVTELVAARAAAESANRAKSRFLANVSHELRTPMNSILGLINLALPKQQDATARDFLQTAHSSANLLLSLLNDLLDLAKIEAGKLELEAAPFSLRRAVLDTVRVLESRATEKQLQLSCDIPAEVPDRLEGDVVRVRQILMNLLANGIKFTEAGSLHIGVRVQERDGDVVELQFAVHDTGIGIAAEQLDRIFRPFVQADSSTTRRFGGTGLGLTICSALAKLMGGQLRAESTPGHGSTFYFTARFPCGSSSLAHPSVPMCPPQKQGGHYRVLLAEDNPANQKLASYVLQERGHRVDLAGNGRDAVQMVERNRYDVVLMDVQMPEMDGIEATKAIRAAENRHHLPIIAMTAHAMKGDREWCLSSGMDAYLAKPIDASEMLALVETFAANNQESYQRIEPAGKH